MEVRSITPAPPCITIAHLPAVACVPFTLGVSEDAVAAGLDVCACAPVASNSRTADMRVIHFGESIVSILTRLPQLTTAQKAGSEMV